MTTARFVLSRERFCQSSRSKSSLTFIDSAQNYGYNETLRP